MRKNQMEFLAAHHATEAATIAITDRGNNGVIGRS